MPSVEAMVRSSPAGRFLDQQVSFLQQTTVGMPNTDLCLDTFFQILCVQVCIVRYQHDYPQCPAMYAICSIATATLPLLTFVICVLQTAGSAILNQGTDSVELAKPFLQGQQLIQNEREASGHEAAPRHALLCLQLPVLQLSPVLLATTCTFLRLLRMECVCCWQTHAHSPVCHMYEVYIVNLLEELCDIA